MLILWLTAVTAGGVVKVAIWDRGVQAAKGAPYFKGYSA